MQRMLKHSGWRILFLRLALLTVFWLVVAFVFATELFLMTRGGPLEIPWTTAAGSAFRDWFPWILLSPIAVVLAGQFRFDRKSWRRSLAVHFAACLAFTLVYEGLSVLIDPVPFSTSPRGKVRILMTTDAAVASQSQPLKTASAPSLDTSAPPLLMLSNTQATGSERVLYGTGFGSSHAHSNMLAKVARRGEGASFRTGATGTPRISAFSPGSVWSRFLHLAMLRTQFTIPIYFCIVCVCWVVHHFREANERERRTLELESRLTQAHLQTLKVQLQPHFLFNALNAISSLIHDNPKAADDMIGSFSQFLRGILDVSSKDEVPLRTELEFLDRYLEIQQTRFGDRLRVAREIDATVMEALVPPLILQPLVENAIRHGIESRERGGTVTIRVRRDGDMLRLEVLDDGRGFSAGNIFVSGSGIGLSNTKGRLQALYGEQHQLTVSAQETAGTRVTIRLPFHLADPDLATKT